jgi:hypothetical protein
MGKKSKRKGAAGGSNKNNKTSSSRKNRGPPKLSIQDAASDSDDDEDYVESNVRDMKRLIIQGTRVFYGDLDNNQEGHALWRRAVIQDIQWHTDTTTKKTILTTVKLVLFSDAVDEKEVVLETTDVNRLRYDGQTTDWMLRFKPGTLVVCHVSPTNDEYDVNQYVWQLAKIHQTYWTQHECDNYYPHFPPLASYHVKCLDPITRKHNGDVRNVYYDSPSSVYEFQEPRFQRGDNVLISTDLAFNLRPVSSSGRQAAWVHAVVAKVNVLGRSDHYFPYEVEVAVTTTTTARHRGARKETYYIRLDTDECICGVSETPRQRFFSAVESDCSWQHLDYLMERFHLNVKSFLELVIL